MTRRTVTCVESDKLIADSLSVVGGHHNYMKGNPDFTDPRGRAETVTIWETADGDWLTNTLDADGCTHYVEPAPLNFSTMSDTEIVTHVEDADIGGRVVVKILPEFCYDCCGDKVSIFMKGTDDEWCEHCRRCRGTGFEPEEVE